MGKKKYLTLVTYYFYISNIKMSLEWKNNLYQYFAELFPTKEYQPIIKRAVHIHTNISKQYESTELHKLIHNYIIAWSRRNRVDSLFSLMDTDISPNNIKIAQRTI